MRDAKLEMAVIYFKHQYSVLGMNTPRDLRSSYLVKEQFSSNLLCNFWLVQRVFEVSVLDLIFGKVGYPTSRNQVLAEDLRYLQLALSSIS